MKLNFWQWLGVALLIIGLAWVLYDRTRATDDPAPALDQPPAQTAPTEQPDAAAATAHPFVASSLRRFVATS